MNLYDRRTNHQHHQDCGCPALYTAAWIAPAFRRLEPIIMLAPASPSAVADMTKLIDSTGLRRGVLVEAAGAVAHVQDNEVGFSSMGGWIGPIPASGQWPALARKHGQVVLLVGTALVPRDMKGKEYLVRHGDDMVAGLVPIAGAVPHAGPGGTCGAIVAPVPLGSTWPLRTR